MKHRERVLRALSHEDPDRCPFNVAFTPEFAARLTEEVQTGPGVDYNPHGAGNTFELADVVDTDFRLTSVGWSNSYYAQPGSYTDEWGVQWRSVEYETPYGTGRYTEISERPLADDSAVEAYAPPDPGRPELYEHGAGMVRDLKDEYWIVGGVACTVFETAWALRGMDRLLMDFVVDPDLADAILDIPYNYHLAAARRLVEIGVDMVWLGDDVGTQSGMLMSPDHWRR
ncbi:MAG: uroporphyrinogen decarboxylase/cobalamine-independent methonine synthase family protein, partial [Planctomycetota bacterium]